MARDQQSGGECPNCKTAEVMCSYNLFEQDELRIDAWEHKCFNCGWRETKAYRSDEEMDGGANPQACPWCGRSPRE